MKLNIELVPKTCLCSNLRAKFKKSDWDEIRKNVIKKDGMHCHICGQESDSLVAHEIWEFDEKNHIQKLTDIIGVCSKCHNAIHYGKAQEAGNDREAREQFIKVNDCDLKDFNDELLRTLSKFNRLSKIKDWKLDLSFLENQGYTENEDDQR